MIENLTNRVGRIVCGSVNALIDAVENAAPETVMEEAIREIDSAVDEVRAELGRVIANKHLANTRLMEENRKHEELIAKIDLAIAEGRDDLAEAAIAQQLDIEAQIPVLESTIGECAGNEKELDGYIYALQGKKREMQNELVQFAKVRKESAAGIVALSPSGTISDSSIARKIENAQNSFSRVFESNTGVSSSNAMADKATAVQLDELDNLTRKKTIEERLSAIKRKRQ